MIKPMPNTYLLKAQDIASGNFFFELQGHYTNKLSIITILQVLAWENTWSVEL